jgi:hypothetical protein
MKARSHGTREILHIMSRAAVSVVLARVQSSEPRLHSSLPQVYDWKLLVIFIYLAVRPLDIAVLHVMYALLMAKTPPHLSSMIILIQSSKAPSPRSTLPTLQISRSSSTSSLERPNPPCPPSASFLSLAVFANLRATRLK